jgi:hypothetical protein
MPGEDLPDALSGDAEAAGDLGEVEALLAKRGHLAGPVDCRQGCCDDSAGVHD